MSKTPKDKTPKTPKDKMPKTPKDKTPKTTDDKMPKTPKEQPNIEKGKHFELYKRNPIHDFHGSSGLVSIGLAVVKLNPTRFASISTC